MIGYLGDATSLNPVVATDGQSYIAEWPIYDSLVELDDKLGVKPLLAESWEVSRDGLTYTFKLKKGVKWHDGKPFTADDLVATWEWVADPASAAVTSGAYKDIARIDKPDSHTAKITFSRPAPFPFEPFCGPNGQVMAKHVIEPFKGAKSRDLPANLKPVGTGPYRIVDFKPGDAVKAELNPNYHVPNRPFFDTLEMRRCPTRAIAPPVCTSPATSTTVPAASGRRAIAAYPFTNPGGP